MTNPLQTNLSIVQSKYPPGQVELILGCLNTKPEIISEDWDLPPVDPSYPPRLMLFLGCPNIRYLYKLANDPMVKKTAHQIIVVESNPAYVSGIMNVPASSGLLNSPTFKFILGANVEQFKSLLFSILKQPELSRIMRCCQVYPRTTAAEIGMYEQMAKAYDEVVFHVLHNYGRIDDSLEGVEATLKNEKGILNDPGILDLKYRAAGKPVAIVAAGPSLDKSIESLARNKDKLIIIAADAAVKPLLKHGITPDFTTSIERGNLYQRPFWETLPDISTQLVHYPVVHPDVLSIYPGPKRVVYRNYSYYAYFEKRWKKGMLLSGGSTSHLANRLAIYMGAAKILFVGIDSTYEKHPEQDLYRSHCNNLGHSEWAEYHPLEYFFKEKKHAPSYLVEATNGSSVYTNVTYHQWAKEFAEEVINLGLEGRIFTAAEAGIKINGIKYQSVDEFCKDLPSIESRDFSHKPLNKQEKWDHSHLLKSVKGWLHFATVGRKLLAKDRTNNPSDVVVQYRTFLNDKFLLDHMFIAFVIQNCAAEFYNQENEWYALDSTLAHDYEKKVEWFDKRLQLYEEVLTKLLKVVEESWKPNS